MATRDQRGSSRAKIGSKLVSFLSVFSLHCQNANCQIQNSNKTLWSSGPIISFFLLEDFCDATPHPNPKIKTTTTILFFFHNVYFCSVGTSNVDIASEDLLANFDTSGLRAGRGENCGERKMSMNVFVKLFLFLLNNGNDIEDILELCCF